MPIKFRCKHCRQFLGISRSKAGSVVDCPTCGRTVRVPQLDGKVKPLPKPKLNLEDSALASAMNELASLGEGSENETSDFLDSSSEGDQQQPLHTKTHSNVDLDIPEAPSFYHGKEQHADEELPVEEELPVANESDVLVDKTKKTGFVSNETYSPPVQPQVIEMPPLATPEPIELAPAAKQNEYKDEILFPKKQQPADSALKQKAVSTDSNSAELDSLAKESQWEELSSDEESTFSQAAVPFQFPPQKKNGDCCRCRWGVGRSCVGMVCSRAV